MLLLALREGSDVFGYPGVPATKRPEFRHKVGVGQETHIEYQVGVLRHPVPEPKADAGDQNIFARSLLFELFGNVGAQFMDVEFGGVDHEVGNGTDGFQMPPLFL